MRGKGETPLSLERVGPLTLASMVRTLLYLRAEGFRTQPKESRMSHKGTKSKRQVAVAALVAMLAGVGAGTAAASTDKGGRVIRADTISFNRTSNVVSASGNVSLLEPTGDVVFADYAELTEDLREGAIQNFRALLSDWSRLAAVSGRRSAMRKATSESWRISLSVSCDTAPILSAPWLSSRISTWTSSSRPWRSSSVRSSRRSRSWSAETRTDAVWWPPRTTSRGATASTPR